jgi:hypothetical protein
MKIIKEKTILKEKNPKKQDKALRFKQKICINIRLLIKKNTIKVMKFRENTIIMSRVWGKKQANSLKLM